MINPVYIDLHDPGKLLGRLLQKRLFPSQDTRTTDQDIQPSILLHRLGHRRIDLQRIGDIRFDE